MHYHIILTEICNSNCRYCYEKSLKEFENKLEERFSFDFSCPSKSSVEIDKLNDLATLVALNLEGDNIILEYSRDNEKKTIIIRLCQ